MARLRKLETLDDWLESEGIREECMTITLSSIAARNKLDVLYGTTASLIEGYEDDDSIPDWLMEKIATFHNEVKTYLYADS